MNPAALALPAGATARLSLPDGHSYRLTVLPPQQHASGNTTWRARLVGAQAHVVTLTGGERAGLVGTLLTPRGEYRVTPGTGAWNAVSLTKLEPRPGAYAFDAVPRRELAPRGLASTPIPKDHGPSVLNVLVRYSSDVRAGRSNAEWDAYLDQLFADTNLAFRNSGTDVEIRMVADQLSDISDVISNAAAMEELAEDEVVAEWRFDLDAHFVTVLRTHRTSHGPCGAARLPVCGDDARCYDEDMGYSAVSVGGACSALTLAHQLGHNLGSAHEAGDGQDGTYPYSHAHVTAGGVGTVMSTLAAPTASFSSPSLDCAGAPCGVADASDNVRSLRQTRHYIERWLTDHSIAFVDSPAPVIRGESVDVAFTWFGILGTRFDIGLYRDGALVEALVDNLSIEDGTRTLTIPETVAAGEYSLRVSSDPKPEVFAEASLTVDDPLPVAKIEFTTPQITATGGTATLRVARGGVTTTTVTVEYATMGGSAHAGSEYTPVSGSFTWGPGDTSERTITVTNISAAESGNQTSIFVVLRNPSAGAEIGDPAEIVIPGEPGGGGGDFGAGALAALAGLLWMRRRQIK